jgi:hypothetical protein
VTNHAESVKTWCPVRRPPIGLTQLDKKTMQVTQEDGGKLNAFATEPRMVVMEAGERNPSHRPLWFGGLVLVAVLLAVASRIS